MAPGGQGADEQDDQDDNQDNSHDNHPLLFFILLYRGMVLVSNATVAAGSRACRRMIRRSHYFPATFLT